MRGSACLARFDAVLFDMDGTLVDTEELWFEAGRSVARGFGVHLPAAAASDLHGLDVPSLVRELQRRYGMEAGVEEYSGAILEEVLARLAGAESRPGARELIEGTAATGKEMALVSNSSHQVISATLAPYPWSRLLERRVSVDDVERGKPHPDIYLHAAASLGTAPERCVAIEDSVAGATAAAAAGASCIAVTFGDAPERFGGITERVVESLGDVAGLLLEGE